MHTRRAVVILKTNGHFKKISLIVVLSSSALILVLFYVLAMWSEPADQQAPGDKVLVSDATSGIAGARLFQFDENGRLKYSHAAWVLPLNNPEWRSPGEATRMKPDDPVLGLHFHGNSWALPWWIIKNHHVANLVLEGEPVLIAFCENCSSGIALDPVVNGRRLTFHIAGLYNGSIFLTDYETKSYWTPFTGEALEGPLKGTTLKQMALIQCRWNEWVDLHPRTLVAYGPERLRKGHGFNKRPGWDGKDFLSLLVKPLDRRLRFSELVLGVTVDGEARAYALSALDAGESSTTGSVVVNDKVGNDEIVILHRRGSWLATAYSRRLGDKTLGFASDKDGRFIDSTYSSHWSYQGEAVDGPAAGQQLSSVISRVEEWYIWAAYNPKTSIFGRMSGERD